MSPWDRDAELVAVLPVPDLDRALAWYGLVGFSVTDRYGDDYAVLHAGSVWLHLASHRDGADPDESLSGVYLYVADADAVHAAWVAAGVAVLHPPIDQPYGLREFATEDPAGNLWRVGSRSDPDPSG